MVQQELNTAMERKKNDIVDEVTNQSVALMILLPMKVLIEDYWPKTYKQKLPGFIDKTMQYYSDWQDNKLDIEELKDFLWNEVGIKVESCKVED